MEDIEIKLKDLINRYKTVGVTDEELRETYQSYRNYLRNCDVTHSSYDIELYKEFMSVMDFRADGYKIKNGLKIKYTYNKDSHSVEMQIVGRVDNNDK
jgi:hypothetical protein